VDKDKVRSPWKILLEMLGCFAALFLRSNSFHGLLFVCRREVTTEHKSLAVFDIDAGVFRGLLTARSRVPF
jgi:hypothetical protein